MTIKRSTKNFAEVIRAELSVDSDMAKEVAEEFFQAAVAQQVYKLRTNANLTQKELAKLAGTPQSTISRLEDADYEGHLLSILLQIAFALKKELKIEFADPIRGTPPRRKRSSRMTSI